MVERYAYTPYGVVTVYDSGWLNPATTAVGNTTLYAGRDYSFATQLYFNRGRFYDPALQVS